MGTPINIHIQNWDELSLLLSCHKYRLFPAQGRIVLHLQLMSQAESDFWQGQLNRLYFAAGGSTVITYAAAVAFMGLVYWVASLGHPAGEIGSPVAVTALVLLSGAGGGMLMGYCTSKQRLRSFKKQLFERINHLEADHRLPRLYGPLG